MADSSGHDDVDIIYAAYAERVREAFRIFADNLGVGENEKLCRDRFQRALQMVRRARDLALQEAGGANGLAAAAKVEPAAPSDARAAAQDKSASEALSAEYQSMVDKALAGTRGTGR